MFLFIILNYLCGPRACPRNKAMLLCKKSTKMSYLKYNDRDRDFYATEPA